MDGKNIVYMKVADVIPYVNNPRHNEDAITKVMASIKEFGFQNPIILDKNNVIVTGHTRLAAAKRLGLEQVPCLVAKELTEAQVKAYRLADNKVGELAEWDMEKLRIEFESLQDMDFNLEMSGFDMDEIADIIDAADAAAVGEEDDFEPELPEIPKSQLGDIYVLGRHRLMCGDSTKIDQVGQMMDGDKADIVFTDPPWNVNYGADQNHPSWKPRTIINDFMGTEDFKTFMFEAFKCMNEHSKPGAMTYVVMSAQEWGNMMLTLLQNDYHWSSTIIWNKDHLVLSRKDYHTKYEPIWYGWKDGESRLCPLEDRKQADVWDIDRPTKSELHPTMKPVELVARALNNSSKINSTVLDLFGGSGTTLIAAEQTKRHCRMMELDPKYVDVIVNRYIALKESDKDVFLLRNAEKIPFSEII